jgi:hypothetical protein
MAGQRPVPDEHSAQEYKDFLGGNRIRNKEGRRLQLQKYLLSNERELDFHLSKLSRRPRSVPILGKIDSCAVQLLRGAGTAKRDWIVKTDGHALSSIAYTVAGSSS